MGETLGSLGGNLVGHLGTTCRGHLRVTWGDLGHLWVTWGFTCSDLGVTWEGQLG